MFLKAGSFETIGEYPDRYHSVMMDYYHQCMIKYSKDLKAELHKKYDDKRQQKNAAEDVNPLPVQVNKPEGSRKVAADLLPE